MTFAQALAVSVAAHAALAAALLSGRLKAKVPDEGPSLDVGRIELSLVDLPPRERSAAAPSAVRPAAEAPARQLPPAFAMPTMEVAAPPDVAPPEFAAEAEAVADPPETVERLSEGPASVAAEDAPCQAAVDAPPQLRGTIRPDYPRGARRRGEEGEVVLELEIGADGCVAAVRVRVSCGFPELDAAAVKAARRAVFAPATSAGRAVAAAVRLPLRFRLR